MNVHVSFIVVPSCLEKIKKMSIRILPKCRCVSVDVMLQNGLGNGIFVVLCGEL